MVFERLARRARDGLSEDEIAEIGIAGPAAAAPSGPRVPSQDPPRESGDVGLTRVGREHPTQRNRVGRTRRVVEQGGSPAGPRDAR